MVSLLFKVLQVGLVKSVILFVKLVLEPSQINVLLVKILTF
jgi:hypothetical protein